MGEGGGEGCCRYGQIWIVCGFALLVYNLLAAQQTVSTVHDRPRSLVQITCKTSGANHVRGIVCRVTRRDSPAIYSDRAEIPSIVRLFHCLKPLRGEGQEDT